MFGSNQGRGLGLSLCKKLCDMFDWSIKFKSKVYFGTTVTFTFTAKHVVYLRQLSNNQKTYLEYLTNHTSSAFEEKEAQRHISEEEDE